MVFRHIHLSFFERGPLKALTAFWIALLCILLFSTKSFALSFLDGSDVDNADDHLVIIQVKIDNYLLHDGLQAYYIDDRLLLPLQELSQTLEFPIEVDLEAKTASGWYIEESQKFELDLKGGKISFEDRELEIPQDATTLVDEWDIYIDSEALANWFDLQLGFNFSYQLLEVVSRQKLPLQTRLERELKREKSFNRSNRQTGSESSLPDSYGWLGIPNIDIGLSSTITDIAGRSDKNTSLSFLGAWDMAKHSTQLSINHTTSSRENIRLAFSRDADTDKGTIYPGIKNYEFGDIYTLRSNLVTSGGAGLGFSINSANHHGAGDFSRHTIEGDVPAGWEVELYRNGSLLDFSISTNDGRYLFADISTQYGLNNFEVRLYGPQGQKRVIQETVEVAPNQLNVGEMDFSFSHIDKKSRIFGSNAASSISGAENVDSFQYYYGVSDDFLLGINASYLKSSNDSESYQTLLGQYSSSGVLTQLELSNQQGGGHAGRLGLKANVAGLSINVEHINYHDFVSDVNSLGGLLHHESELEFIGYYQWEPRINYSFRFREISQVASRRQYSMTNRLSTNIFSSAISNTLEYNYSEGGERDALEGKLRATTILGLNLRASGDITYQLSGEASGFKSLAANLGWRHSSTLSSQFGVSYSHQDKKLSLNENLTMHFDEASVSLAGGLDTEGDWSFGSSVNFSVGYDESKDQVLLSSSPLATTGMVTLRVFLDKNANEIFDGDDEPLPEVSFYGRSDWSKLITNENGMVSLPGIPARQPYSIRINRSSIIDPYWQPVRATHLVYSHPGGKQHLDVPVVILSEVEGSVQYLVSNKGAKPGPRLMRGVPVLLLDKEGKVVNQTSTEYDGFFLFEQVLPGQYSVVIDPGYLGKKEFIVSASPIFDTDPEGGVIYIDTFNLRDEGQLDTEVIAAKEVEKPAHDSILEEIITDVTQWILGQPRTAFAIQLASSFDEQGIKSFISENKLERLAKYYEVPGADGIRYVLTYGYYDNYELAKLALNRLSENLRTNSPWVRSFRSMQKDLVLDRKNEVTVPVEDTSTPQKNKFAIQLMGAYKRESATYFIERNKLQDKVSIYETRFKGRPWFIVLYGAFNHYGEASDAIDKLSSALTKYKPWIRNLSSIQRQHKKLEQRDRVAFDQAVDDLVINSTPMSVVDSVSLNTSAEPDQEAGDYYIQLLAGKDELSIKAFQQLHKIENDSFYMRTRRDSDDWFVLMYGEYSTISEANKAKVLLPEGLADKGAWVRSLSELILLH